jgi:hypothetical protein
MVAKRRKSKKPRCGGLTKLNRSCTKPMYELGPRCKIHQGEPDAATRRKQLKAEKAAAGSKSRSTARPRESPLRSGGLGLMSGSTRRSRPPPASRPKHNDLQTLRRLHADHKKAKEAAIEVGAEIVLDGWQETVAGQLSDRLSPELLRVTTHRWRGQHCRQVARLARLILKSKARLHEVLGAWFFRLFEWLGRPRYEQLLARELAKRMPLPVLDEYARAVARSLQIVGVAMCLHARRKLTRCACFKDVVLTEGKDMVKRLMRLSIENWQELNKIPA